MCSSFASSSQFLSLSRSIPAMMRKESHADRAQTHTHAPTSWMSSRLFLLFLFSFQLECARKLVSHVITYSSIIAVPDAWVNVLLFLLLLLAESIAFGHGCIEPMLERCSDFFLHSVFWHNPNGCVAASSSSSTFTICAPAHALSLSPY